MPRYLPNSGLYPYLDQTNHEITSRKSRRYNCAAWVLGLTNVHWWPDADHFWPEGVPLEASIDAFKAAYTTVGFGDCDNGDPEDGYQKIAIYATRFESVHHVASQRPDGGWTSKMGWLGEDIRHNTEKDVAGGAYHNPLAFMKRPWPNT
ncbi:MAG TPA: hypothetical protein VJB57_03145 [Dehalococcoidia bacterium]|nr:hypothetical protein [Dehalococcoidia bacterium]